MDILFFAILALYIFFMLTKRFGKISEDEKADIYRKLEERKKQIEAIIANAKVNEQKTAQNQKDLAKESSEKLVGESSTLEKDDFKKLDKATAENLKKIFSACGISYDFFANGAKGAFEMIIKAFADEDLETLRNLLSQQIYQNFESVISKRKEEGKRLITNLIAIDSFEIVSAMAIDNQASITAKYVSRQINYFADPSGNLIDGKKDQIDEITDIWTFKKDISNPNPNWLIISTAS